METLREMLWRRLEERLMAWADSITEEEIDEFLAEKAVRKQREEARWFKEYLNGNPDSDPDNWSTSPQKIRFTQQPAATRRVFLF